MASAAEEDLPEAPEFFTIGPGGEPPVIPDYESVASTDGGVAEAEARRIFLEEEEERRKASALEFTDEKWRNLLDRCHIPEDNGTESGGRRVQPGVSADELKKISQHPSSQVFSTYKNSAKMQKALGMSSPSLVRSYVL